MKTILSAALVALTLLGLNTHSHAQEKKDDKANPVGTWACEYEIGGMKRTATLTIKIEGDKIVGTMSWADQKDHKLKDLKFKEGKLAFSAVRKFMDNEIPIDYTFTVDGDKLKGKGASDFGGQKQEFDIEAKREVEKKDK